MTKEHWKQFWKDCNVKVSKKDRKAIQNEIEIELDRLQATFEANLLDWVNKLFRGEV